MDSDLHEELDRLRDEIIAAISPPWWENWAMAFAFVAGAFVGYLITTWYL
jgi:hypothetical protein